MNDLPEKFIENMKKQLPEDEWEAFFAVYARPPYKGLRVNALKISAAEFEKISPFPLRPVPWAENGFYTDGERRARTPITLRGCIILRNLPPCAPRPFWTQNRARGFWIFVPLRAGRERSSRRR